MDMIKSLKYNNSLYISLFVMMNAIVLYTVAQTNTIAFSGFKALLTEATNILPVGFAFIVATVANGLLSADMKARLVFLRWNHALPGHRAFSNYAVSDPRVHIAKLKKACGKEFPDDPVEQNRTWFRFYKTVENNHAVAQVSYH
jgi:hypothetical protein